MYSSGVKARQKDQLNFCAKPLLKMIKLHNHLPVVDRPPTHGDLTRYFPVAFVGWALRQRTTIDRNKIYRSWLFQGRGYMTVVSRRNAMVEHHTQPQIRSTGAMFNCICAIARFKTPNVRLSLNTVVLQVAIVKRWPLPLRWRSRAQRCACCPSDETNRRLEV